MGKQGPCCHCGISTTPLWRNGPPEKPVLCNACGSRWRTKGTLLNYMPMHSGGFGGAGGPEGSSDLRWARGKKLAHKHSSEPRSHKRKEPCDSSRGGRSGESGGSVRVERSSSRGLEEEFLVSDGGAMHLSALSEREPAVLEPLWEGPVPSRKRTSMFQARTSLDKITRHFQALMSESSAVAPHLTTNTATTDALLVEYNAPLVGVEIGLGSVLLQQVPAPVYQEPEGESKLITIDSSGGGIAIQALNQRAEARASGPLTQLPNGAPKSLLVRGKEKAKQVSRKMEGGGSLHSDRCMTPNKALLENFPYNKRDVLQSCQSPLVFLEMKDIVNFDTLTGLLTDQEQGQLMKFVSSVDAARVPESLKAMFSSAQFEGALTNFQQLLSEGMFDSAELGVNPRILQHFQQLLTVVDLTHSYWMDRCSQLQNRHKRRGGSADYLKGKEGSKDKVKGYGLPSASAGSVSVKHSPGRLLGQGGASMEEDLMPLTGFQKQNGNLSPLSSHGTAYSGFAFGKHLQSAKLATQDTGSSSKDGALGLDAGGTCFPGNSLLLPDRGCLVSVDDLPDFQVPGSDGTEPDLLFDIPSNMMPFQQAELLQQPAWIKSKEENDSNQVCCLSSQMKR